MNLCFECCYWRNIEDENGDSGDEGECHYNAPIPHWSPTHKILQDYPQPPFLGAWPLVNAFDFCSKWRFLEPDEE